MGWHCWQKMFLLCQNIEYWTWCCESLWYAGERPYHCDVCGKSYRRTADLITHKRIHSGQKPFHCESCEKRFRTVRQLRDHQRTHSGARPFPCPLCGKMFRQPGHVIEHVRTHTGIKFVFMSIYCCSLCTFAVCLSSLVLWSYARWASFLESKSFGFVMYAFAGQMLFQQSHSTEGTLTVCCFISCVCVCVCLTSC